MWFPSLRSAAHLAPARRSLRPSLILALLLAPVILPLPCLDDRHTPGSLQAQGLGSNPSFDEKVRQHREAFLKAREEMRTIPLPSPTPGSRPVAKPTPAPPPVAADTPPPPDNTPTPAPTATPGRAARSTPTPAATNDESEPDASVVVRKGGGQEGEENTDYPPPPRKKGFFFGLFGGGPTYRYLTPRVLDAIDRAKVRAGRWKYTVVHNSGTRQGNAAIFDYYHLHTRHMPNGLAYHFVIGNGTSTGDGEIEIGNRWKRQINGGHVHSDYLNNIAIGICLVGDYNRDVPTRAQYAALDELITYLRKRVGRVDRRLSIVKAHREINPVPTDCPGNRFSYTWLHRKFD